MVVLLYNLVCRIPQGNPRLNLLHSIYIFIFIKMYFLHICLQQMSSCSNVFMLMHACSIPAANSHFLH